MANVDHVRRLRIQAAAWAKWKSDNRRTNLWSIGVDYDSVVKSVFTWNAWRRDNPLVVPDLKGANLHEVDLGEANLCGADLNKASLVRANLTNDYFDEANLSEAGLE